MSFLIDDILKHNSNKGSESISPDTSSSKADINSEVNSLCTNKNTSILEYTLTNRNYYGSEVHQEIYSNKYAANFDPFLTSYQDSYGPKPTSTQYPYTRRDSIWSTYVPYPVMFNYHHIHAARRKGGQVRFTTSQTEELEKQFNSHKYLSPEDRKQLAHFLRLSDRQVKTWFQNRRAKWRRNSQVGPINHHNELIIKNIREATPNIANTRINFQY